MRVLTWNLFHGRSVPDTPRELLPEFGAALARWEWDVALLQEMPPWWAEPLARTSGADAARVALTSRNALLPLRRALARRRPDLLKSNGGGANAILVRPSAGVVDDHRRHVLRRLPERRVVHAVALRGGSGGALARAAGHVDDVLWIGNLHATQARPPRRADEDPDVTRPREDVAAATAWTRARAGRDAPFVLGGDLNDRAPAPPGLVVLASRSVDHVTAVPSLAAVADGDVLPRGREVDGRAVRLSDHSPLVVRLRAAE